MTTNPTLPVAPDQYTPALENLRSQQIEDYLRDHLSIQLTREMINTVMGWVAANFSVATYASMQDNAISVGSLDGTWKPFDNYTSDQITPKDITTDLVAGTLAFQHTGVYQVIFGADIAHDENNAGRSTGLRLFNVTLGTPGTGIDVFIARNQPGTNLTALLLVEISTAQIGHEFRVEIGGGDVVGTVSGKAHFDAFMVSEWKADLIDPFAQAASLSNFTLPNSFLIARQFDPMAAPSPFVVTDSRIHANSFVQMHIITADKRLEIGEVRNGSLDIEYPPPVNAPVEVKILVVN